MACRMICAARNFNPRTPCGVRRRVPHLHRRGRAISIHAPRVGCDRSWGSSDPAGRCISIHAPRVGCDVNIFMRGSARRVISIHAPRVGCDTFSFCGLSLAWNFNPRTPCGVRQRPRPKPPKSRGFQSTHPVWGATRTFWRAEQRRRNFNPRTPCGVRHSNAGTANSLRRYFNPRTPCGVRPGGPRTSAATPYFNPRTPCGVRPGSSSSSLIASAFQSTHPVWGATSAPAIRLTPMPYFNPRTPCGVRPLLARIWSSPHTFQSTHPVWGATLLAIWMGLRQSISIHAPRVGCDSVPDCCGWPCGYFNPRTPCGVRRPGPPTQCC